MHISNIQKPDTKSVSKIDNLLPDCLLRWYPFKNGDNNKFRIFCSYDKPPFLHFMSFRLEKVAASLASVAIMYQSML